MGLQISIKYCIIRDIFGILIKMADSNLASEMYRDPVEKCKWEGDST